MARRVSVGRDMNGKPKKVRNWTKGDAKRIAPRGTQGRCSRAAKRRKMGFFYKALDDAETEGER
jgi:hypothetical protein